MAVKEETLVMQATSEKYEVTLKGKRESGSPFSARCSDPTKGGPVTYSEGAPSAGTSDAWKKINDSTGDFITTQTGKVILTQHCAVKGTTLRCDQKGIDGQGKPVQGVLLYDKQ
jgi:hypothetical protein